MTRNTSFSVLIRTLALVLLLIGTAYADVVADHIVDNTECDFSSLPDVMPTWGEEQIIASRAMDEVYLDTNTPVWGRDLSSIGPDGRYAFIISCEGWVQKYDIWSQKPVGLVRAGLNSNDIAISTDGKWLAIANYLPTSLAILSTDDLSVGIVHEVLGDDDKPSRISAVHSNPLNESFILSLRDAPKIWEVFYGPNPPAVGFVHDWRIEGPPPQPDRFPIRKFTIPDIVGEFIFDPSYEFIMATSNQNDGGIVIDLVIGQRVTDFDLLPVPELSGN